jgi:hypothetical protein
MIGVASGDVKGAVEAFWNLMNLSAGVTRNDAHGLHSRRLQQES